MTVTENRPPPQDDALIYIGLKESEAVASATSAGIRDIQVVRSGQVMTADLSPTRLKLFVADGTWTAWITAPATQAWGTLTPRYCTGKLPGSRSRPANSSGKRAERNREAASKMVRITWVVLSNGLGRYPNLLVSELVSKWATDKTQVPRGDGRVSESVSHATALDFTHFPEAPGQRHGRSLVPTSDFLRV